MPTKLDDVLKGYKDAITVGKVFGDPYEKNGVTVIPAASVAGGGGGGEGEGERDGEGTGTGSGSGFGLAGRPAGAFVIRNGEVTWQPAIDVNRIVSGAFALLALALLVRLRRTRYKRR